MKLLQAVQQEQERWRTEEIARREDEQRKIEERQDKSDEVGREANRIVGEVRDSIDEKRRYAFYLHLPSFCSRCYRLGYCGMDCC